MSQSPFARSLFIAACVSGAIFSATTAPLAIFKSNIVGIELQNKSIYSSELKYLAGPYLALAGGMSAAVGLGAFGLMGWRQSSRKLAGVESSRQAMAHDLTVHQAELERIKFSEARLRNANLNAFLYQGQAEEADVSTASKIALESKLARPEAGVTSPSIGQPAGQPFANGFSQPIAIDSSRAAYAPSHAPGSEPLDQLLKQLHQLSEQVEELRGRSGNRLAA
jgi:hypothetical protein